MVYNVLFFGIQSGYRYRIYCNYLDAKRVLVPPVAYGPMDNDSAMINGVFLK